MSDNEARKTVELGHWFEGARTVDEIEERYEACEDMVIRSLRAEREKAIAQADLGPSDIMRIAREGDGHSGLLEALADNQVWEGDIGRDVIQKLIGEIGTGGTTAGDGVLNALARRGRLGAEGTAALWKVLGQRKMDGRRFGRGLAVLQRLAEYQGDGRDVLFGRAVDVALAGRGPEWAWYVALYYSHLLDGGTELSRQLAARLSDMPKNVPIFFRTDDLLDGDEMLAIILGVKSEEWQVVPTYRLAEIISMAAAPASLAYSDPTISDEHRQAIVALCREALKRGIFKGGQEDWGGEDAWGGMSVLVDILVDGASQSDLVLLLAATSGKLHEVAYPRVTRMFKEMSTNSVALNGRANDR